MNQDKKKAPAGQGEGQRHQEGEPNVYNQG